MILRYPIIWILLALDIFQFLGAYEGSAIGLIVNEEKIYFHSEPLILKGSNTMHVVEGYDENQYPGINFGREMVWNLKETPLFGESIIDSQGIKLQSLVNVINGNAKRRYVTLVVIAGWDGSQLHQLHRKIPSKEFWYDLYTSKLAEIAAMLSKQFAPTMLEVWNKPFGPDDNTPFAVWSAEMEKLINVVRSAGYEGIIVLPVTGAGQDERVLLSKEAQLFHARMHKHNIIYDVHAHKDWLFNKSATSISNRIKNLVATKLPFIFGEVSPLYPSLPSVPHPVLKAAQEYKIGVAGTLVYPFLLAIHS